MTPEEQAGQKRDMEAKASKHASKRVGMRVRVRVRVCVRARKDTMAAKPLVLYESDDLVAMGSEEIAIRSVLPQEIDTYDPFDGEVKVWQI